MEEEARGEVGEVGEDQGMAAFNISEAELIGLQQGGGLGGLGAQASAEHLSQGDLEALASIQDELDRMAGGQNIIQEEIVMGAGAGLGLAEVPAGGFEASGLELGGLGVGLGEGLVSPSTGARATVRVVKRPAAATQGAVKVRVGEAGGAQQFRIVSTSQALGVAGQQLRIVTAPNHLKAIAPSEPASSMGNISIVNQDGSLTSLPVGGQGIRLVGGQGPRAGLRSQPLQPGLARAQPLHPGLARAQPIQPHQVRILPSQPPQSFKILNADGSLSDVSSSFIRPKSDLNPIPSVSSSPKKKNVTYSSLGVKSPQKVLTLKAPEGAAGQVIRTADGRLISLQGAAKKVVLPASSASSAAPLPIHHTFSPTKIVIRDSLGNNVQTVSAGPRGQVLRLDSAGDKVQYVRVVNSAGKSQTSLRPAGAEVPAVAGRSVAPMGRVAMPVAGPGLVEAGRLEETVETAVAREKPRVATSTMEPQGVRPRKPCNCTKSQCLKLYCDCFANGEFCHNCNCNGCLNNLSNEEERQRSIKQCLDRNPNAFKPKIGKNTSEGERRHNKGCNCKRSGCLKNYCECYEAKIPCHGNCKCLGCKNVDPGAGKAAGGGALQPEAKAGLGAAGQGLHLGERWFKPSTSLRSKLLQAPSALDTGEPGAGLGARQPFSFVSQEVVEATCQCLLSEAEVGERKGKTIDEIERQVLEEFGRCLVQIIEFAGKAKRS